MNAAAISGVSASQAVHNCRLSSSESTLPLLELALQVTPSGAKSWMMLYRTAPAPAALAPVFLRVSFGWAGPCPSLASPVLQSPSVYSIARLGLACITGVLAATAGLSATDEPMVLPRLLAGAPPQIPARAVGWGEVWLEVTVGADGSVAGIRTLRSTPPFTEALRRAISAWRFAPSRVGEASVRTQVIVAALFRPPALYDTPGLGSPPATVAPPSPQVAQPVAIERPVHPPMTVGDGIVVVEALIDAAGTTRQAGVALSTGAGFEDSALRAAGATRFRPARREGRAIDARAYLVFGFRQPVATPRP